MIDTVIQLIWILSSSDFFTVTLLQWHLPISRKCWIQFKWVGCYQTSLIMICPPHMNRINLGVTYEKKPKMWKLIETQLKLTFSWISVFHLSLLPPSFPSVPLIVGTCFNVFCAITDKSQSGFFLNLQNLILTCHGNLIFDSPGWKKGVQGRGFWITKSLLVCCPG